MIEFVEFFKSENIPDSGNWVILNGKDKNLECIISELAGSIVNVNFGIYRDSKNIELIKCKNGKQVEIYNGPIRREDIIIWSL